MRRRHSKRIALVSAAVAQDLDEDLAPLIAALRAVGAEVEVANWDDAQVTWGSYDLALLRSTWDYTSRLGEFLIWAQRVSTLTNLRNPLPLLRWNVDKHYLTQLAAAGVAIVPSEFVEPGQDAVAALEGFLGAHARSAELVVKPSIGAGSRDAERHQRGARAAIVTHVQRLQDAKRGVLLQPYLDRVDDHGETALIFFAGCYSHAVRKGPLLSVGGASSSALFAPEAITPREAAADELALAERVLDAMPFERPLYARVDLIRDADGAPCLLELEMTEPSLFLRTPQVRQRNSRRPSWLPGVSGCLGVRGGEGAFHL